MSRAGKPNVATRIVTDDYGDALLVRRCSRCRHWKPQGIVDFSPRQRDPETRRVIRWDAYCRVCRNAASRASSRVPAVRERARVRKRERWQELTADPVYMAGYRERNAAKARAERARNPEQARARVRADYRRTMADADRHARMLESRRIAHRLRVERATGQNVTELRSSRVRLPKSLGGRELPTGPLVPLITTFLLRAGTEQRNGDRADDAALARLGMNARLWWSWRAAADAGEGRSARFATLDGVLLGLGLNPWDVWRPEVDAALCDRACAMWGEAYRVATVG